MFHPYNIVVIILAWLSLDGFIRSGKRVVTTTNLIWTFFRVESTQLIKLNEIKMDKEKSKKLLEKARLQANKGMLSEAITFAEEARELAYDNFDVIVELAELFYDMDLVERSVDILESAISSNPNNYMLFIEIGKYQHHIGRYAQAITSFKRAINLETKNASAYIACAISLTAAGNINDAIENYTRALQYNPNDKGSWMMLANLRQSQGDLEGCIHAYKAIHELDNDSVYILFQLVDSLAILGRHEEVESILRKATEKAPGNLELYVKFAEILIDAGRHKEALEINSQAIEIFHKNTDLVIQRSNIFERMGEFDAAFEIIKQLIGNRSVKIEAALTFAKISPFLGMINEAIKLLDFIVKRDRLEPIPINIEMALKWLHDSEKRI